MNNEAFIRGFIKAACSSGVHPFDLVKLANMGSTLLGAVPGAIGGGYLAYNRALQRQKEEPTSMNPQHAGIAGALLGGGAGGLLGSAAGGLGYQNGVQDMDDVYQKTLEAFNNAYAKM